jgi:hypothetical protein
MTDDQPKAGGTYFDRAIADEAVPAGRFAKAPATVNGTTPIVVPPGQLPLHLQCPQPGPEEPLGYSVDELPDMESNQ